MMKQSLMGAGVCVAALCLAARADEEFNSEFTRARIDALYLKTGLIGTGVRIGQIEPDLPLHDHVTLVNQGVQYRSGYSKESAHETGVASLLVGARLHPGLPFRGVAPGAKLYAAWMGPDSLKPPNDQAFLDAFKGAMDWQIKDPKAQVINISWGTYSDTKASVRDATDRIADWGVMKSGSLIVCGAGNDGKIKGDGGDFTGNIISPARGYNVLTVGGLGALDQVFETSSVGQKGKRIKPDLVAPGAAIEAATIVGNSKEGVVPWTGTSFAAPLVSGTAALLMEYGAKPKAFDPAVRNDSRLMRAVLMNSTKKTVTDRTGKRWDELFADGANGEANMSTELGTGGLDAMQAYLQYKAGQKGPTFGVDETKQNVGEMGWDVRMLSGKGLEKSNDYKTEFLRKGTVLASTVCWNVDVITTDGDGKEVGTALWAYDKVPQIFLTITAEGARDTVLSTSDAKDASSQHNVYRIGERNKYYIRVYNGADSPKDAMKYGLAWRSFEMELKKVESFNGRFDGDRGAYRDNGWYAAANTVVPHRMLNEAWMPDGAENWAALLGDGTGRASGIAQELVRPLTYFTVQFDLAVSSMDATSGLHIMLGDVDLLQDFGGRILAMSLGGVDSFVHFSFTLDGSRLWSLSGDFTEISFLAEGGNAGFYLDNVEYVPAPGAVLVLAFGTLAARRRRG